MAMTGAGLEEEGALEAGVAAMSSILGMKGLPREQAPVANLMTGMVKAMGSIACLSEVRYSRHKQYSQLVIVSRVSVDIESLLWRCLYFEELLFGSCSADTSSSIK